MRRDTVVVVVHIRGCNVCTVGMHRSILSTGTVYCLTDGFYGVQYNILRSNLEHEVCYEFVSTTCTSTVHTINAIHFSHMYLFGSCVPLCSVCISPNYNLLLNIETET